MQDTYSNYVKFLRMEACSSFVSKGIGIVSREIDGGVEKCKLEVA